MNKFFATLASTLTASAALFCAAPAHAGNVAWSVDIGGPRVGAVISGGPRYYAPVRVLRPVYAPVASYVAPVVYNPPLVYAAPPVAYYPGGYYGRRPLVYGAYYGGYYGGHRHYHGGWGAPYGRPVLRDHH